uniref:Proteoglycan 4-like n=1 Tax=Panagrellus redivivus TaxID=6233 RepID=A0A7E4WD42_PANRE
MSSKIGLCCCIFGLFALFGSSVGDVVTKSGDNLLVTGNGTVELYLKSDYVGISIPHQVNCSIGQMLMCFEETEIPNRTYCPYGFRSFLIGKAATSTIWADTWTNTPMESLTVEFHSNGTTFVNNGTYNNNFTLEVSANKSVEVDFVSILSGCDVMLTGPSSGRSELAAMSPPYSKRLKKAVNRLSPELEPPPPPKRRKNAATRKKRNVAVAPPPAIKRKSKTPKRSPPVRSNGTPAAVRSKGTPVRSKPYPCLGNTPPVKPRLPVKTASPALAQRGRPVRSNGTPVPIRSTPYPSLENTPPVKPKLPIKTASPALAQPGPSGHSNGTPVPIRSTPYPCLGNTPPVKPRLPIKTALPELSQPGPSGTSKYDEIPAKKPKLTAQPKPKKAPPPIRKPIPIAPKPRKVTSTSSRPTRVPKRPSKKVPTAMASTESVAGRSFELSRPDSDSNDSDIQVIEPAPPQHVLQPQRTYQVRLLQPKATSRPANPGPIPRPPRGFPCILHRIIPSNALQPSGSGLGRPRHPLIEEPPVTTTSRMVPAQSRPITSVQSSVAAKTVSRIPTPPRPRPPQMPIPIQPRIDEESERNRFRTTNGSSVNGFNVVGRIPTPPPHRLIPAPNPNRRIADGSERNVIRTTNGCSANVPNAVISTSRVSTPPQSRIPRIPTPTRPIAEVSERNGATNGFSVLSGNRIPTPPRPRPPPMPTPIRPRTDDESERNRMRTTNGSSVNAVTSGRLPAPPQSRIPRIPTPTRPIADESERNGATNGSSANDLNAVISGRLPAPPQSRIPRIPTPTRPIAEVSERNGTMNGSSVNDAGISGNRIPTPPRPRPPPPIQPRIDDESQQNRFLQTATVDEFTYFPAESMKQAIEDRLVPTSDLPPNVAEKRPTSEESIPEAPRYPPNYFLAFEFDHEFDWAFEEWPHLRRWTHL